MPFAIDQDMIQTVAPECPDQALSIEVLPDFKPSPRPE
jgi:hypothetical protein